MIKVKVVIEHEVPQDVVAKICDDFAEWLEAQGFAFEGPNADKRSYVELAIDFAAHLETTT